MKTTKLLVVVNVVLALLLWARVETRPAAHDGHGHGDQTTLIHASWIHHAPDIPGATGLAEAIVTARVLRVREGTIESQETDPRGRPATMTADVVGFQVTGNDVMRTLRRGERFEVFHLAVPVGDTKVSIEGDPPYEVGEEHLLFLMRGPTVKVGPESVETWIPIGPEGRWQIDRRTQGVQPVSDLEWVEEYRGRPAREVLQEAERAQRESRAGQQE